MIKYANLEDKNVDDKNRKKDDTVRATKKQLSENDPVELILKEK